MAIRPVDLQLSYMAAPQNAAVLNAAQEGPQAAQAAAAAQFAAEVAEREEQIEEPSTVTGAKVRRREQRDPDDQQGRNAPGYRASHSSKADAAGGSALNLEGEGEHFIDVTV